MGQMIPLIAPDGTSGEVPQQNLQSAMQAGAKPGVWMYAPDGSTGIVPRESVAAAVKAGGVPFQTRQALDLYASSKAPGAPPAGGPVPSLMDEAKTVGKEALAGAGKLISGIPESAYQMLRVASPTGLTGAETFQNIAKPPVNLAPSIKESIPGGQTAVSAADLAARAVGHAPLANESIDEAQKNVAEGAGQAAAMGAIPAIARGAQAASEAAAAEGGWGNVAKRLATEEGAPKLTPAEAAEKQASNLSAALEMGGASPKGVLTHEEISKPILQDIRTEAANQGVTKEALKGRNGYAVAQRITGAVRTKYDNAYEALIDPIRDEPVPEAAKSAAASVVAKMGHDAELMDALKQGGNAEFIQNLSSAVSNAQTIGQLDDLRIKLNQLSSKYYGKPEAAQYTSPLAQEALAEAGSSIRNSLYPAIADLYKGTVDESALREMQKTHGAAIAADQMMQAAAQKMSRAASEESAPASVWQRLRGSAYRATMSPRHAAGGMIEKFWPSSTVELFNTRIGRAIEGATPQAPDLALTPPPGRAPAPAGQPELPGLSTPQGWAPVQQGPVVTPPPPDASAARGWNLPPDQSIYQRPALPPGVESPTREIVPPIPGSQWPAEAQVETAYPQRPGVTRLGTSLRAPEVIYAGPGEPHASAVNPPNPAAAPGASPQAQPVEAVHGTGTPAQEQPAPGKAGTPAQPVRDNPADEKRLLSLDSARGRSWASKVPEETKGNVLGTLEDAYESGVNPGEIFSQFGASMLKEVAPHIGLSDAEIKSLTNGAGLTKAGEMHMMAMIKAWLKAGGNK